MAKSSGQFRFRRHDSIGAAAAEDDSTFLNSCFVDTGDLSVLLDCNNPRRIVVGRTGSGKTALLMGLKNRAEHVLDISPESLSLNYIANSTIIRFFFEIGVNLDVFYKLLWRHLFTVEIFKDRYGIGDEAAKKNFLARLLDAVPSRRKQARQKALDYISRFGDTFWEDTEYRTKEITTKFENELQGALGGRLAGVSLDASAARRLTHEERQELVKRGQEVVNSIQVQQLSGILELVKEVLDDPQKRYFIVIDRLDQSWADESIRYRLIRALVDTVREFVGIPNATVIIALRTDLVERVFRETRDAGFQEEKYRSLYLPVTWSAERLVEVLDRRVSKLVRDAYTSADVTHRNVLPQTVRTNGRKDSKRTIEYLLERTWMRPRDLIEFFNLCIEQATNKAGITQAMILQAEGEYSRRRLQSLCDEWHADYPSLADCVSLLKTRKGSFTLGEITDNQVEEYCLNCAVTHEGIQDPLLETAKRVAEGEDAPQVFRCTLASVFYRVGLVGLKTEAYTETQWIKEGVQSVSTSDIDDDSRVVIHPALWRALGITPG
jgi:hypothetical protein